MIRTKPRTGLSLRMATATALACLAVLAAATAAQAAYPGVDGRIAFVRSNDIWFVKSDGTGQINVTNNLANDTDPAWSADGTRMAFTTDRYGTGKDIAIRESDGSVTQITSNTSDEFTPSFSPDGTKIAFATTRNGFSEIWVMNSDGTSQTLLVAGASGQSRADPVWSPDGQWIAYDSLEGSEAVLYKIKPDGSSNTALVRKTLTGLVPVEPDWSPDGTKIAFWTTSLGSSGGDLWTVGADGTSLTHLSSDAAFERDPAFAPVGSQIVFDQPTGGASILDGDLYVIGADGTGRTQVTAGGNGDTDPSWQPAAATPPVLTLTNPAAGARLQQTPLVTGVAGTESGDQADVTVKLYSGAGTGGTLLQTKIVQRDGQTGAFSASLDALDQGTYTVQAEQSDDEGSTGKTAATTFDIDTTGPVPAIASPTEDATTADSSPFISGGAGQDAGDLASVQLLVYAGATAGGTPVADKTAQRQGDGSWSQWVGPLPNGDYTAIARQSDSAGNQGTSAERHFHVDAAPLTGRIAFDSYYRTGDDDIWTVNPDGSHLINVTQNAASDVEPSWSPDGMRLAFATDRWGSQFGDYDIAVREHDGTVTRLTSASGSDDQPAFSPDGTQIAFESWRSGHSELWVMNSDGTNQHMVVPGVEGQSRNSPSWSPDGQWIAYSALELSDWSIYKVHPDGTGNTAVTRKSTNGGLAPVEPRWAPDGNSLLFWTSSLGANGGDLYSVGADGSGLAVVSSDGAFERGPSYSPDAAHVIFAAPAGALSVVNSDLWIMDPDGSGRTRITTDNAGDEHATWHQALQEPVVGLTSPRDGASTNDATPHVAGVASTAPGDDPDVTIKVYAGAGRSGNPVQTHTVPRDDTTGAFATDLDALASGTYTVVAEQSDSGGHTGTSTADTFVVDLVPPVVTIGSPAEGDTVGDRSPFLSGTAGQLSGDQGSVHILVYAGSTATGSPVVDKSTSRAGDGTWSDWVGPLPTGTYTAVVRQADAAGNTGESSPLHFSIDAPPVSGRLAFHSQNRDGNDEIYAIRADGTGLVNLTQNPASDVEPGWSPDGDKLAFATNRYGSDFEIAVRDADGSVTRLTTSPGDDRQPAFSPDGTKIAFQTWRSGNSELYVMNSDGSDQHLVVAGSSGDGRQSPAWSPDGQWIAYQSLTAGVTAIYKVHPDGSGNTAVTRSDTNGGLTPASPKWSPTGDSLIFWTTSLGAHEGDLYKVGADGSGLAVVSDDPQFERQPEYSPDGKSIVFSEPKPLLSLLNSNLVMMDADGSGRTQVTTGDHGDDQVAWQPSSTVPAPTITSPADGDATNDVTPTVAGTAGTAAGDASSVTLTVHAGAHRTGDVVQQVTVPRDPGTGQFQTTLATLAEGLYTVEAEQQDDHGGTGVSAPVSFRVDTTAPAVVITTPADGASYVHGTALAADYSCSDDHGIQSCSGPVADGAAVATNAVGPHAFAVTATDKAGNQTIASASYTITNQAPAVDFASAPTSAVEGAEVDYQYTVSDGDGDPLQVTESCGSAGTLVDTPAANDFHCRFGDGPASSQVTVTADDGIAQTTKALTVTVTNAAPVAAPGGPYSGTVGAPVSFSGSATDPGGDVLTYAWDFDYDGTFDPSAGGPAPSHTYSTDGVHTVALRVTDDDGAPSAIVTAPATIQAVPPPPATDSGGSGTGSSGQTQTPTEPPAQPTPTLATIPTSLKARFAAKRTGAIVRILRLQNVPARALATVTCKQPRKFHPTRTSGCAFKRKKLAFRARTAKVDLAPLFKKRRLALGTTVTIQITAPGAIGKLFVYTVRRGGVTRALKQLPR